MTDWLESLRTRATDPPLAMISVLACEGSAPRGAGTRMLVGTQVLHGTIGGGQLEFRAVEQARAILGLAPGSWRIQDYPLGPLLGQCCGGRVRLLIEHLDPARLDWVDQAGEARMLVSTLTRAHVAREISDTAMPVVLSARGERPDAGAQWVEAIGERRRPLYLFGAGHVGQAIASHATRLPFALAWYDTRADYQAIDGVSQVDEDVIESCLGDAPDAAALLILTHDHALDYRLTRAALDRASFAFVGLIGSATKRARFLHRLEADGISAEARDRLTSPIGIAGVAGKQPDVIAVSALAQLLQLGALS